MVNQIKRLLNIILLGVVYIELNVYSFFYAVYCLLKGKGSPNHLIHHLASLLEPKYTRVKGSQKMNGGKTMYFVNHRSWADFFVDGDMLAGSSYLSRMAVIFAFPTACLCGYLNQFIWFFKRQRGISRDWFTHFFKENWDVRNDSGVIVYPEGHRYKGEGSLELKTGVMEVAYNLKVPCQIVLSTGKENLMDEINLRINRHTLITICLSDVLHPEQYKTKEEWFEYVKEEWKKTYTKLHSTESDGVIFEGALPTIRNETVREETLPPRRRLIAGMIAAGMIALFAMLVRLVLWNLG